MAIVFQVVIESRRFSGWLDHRYPIGYWWGAGSLTGDATGGAHSVALLFQQANGAARLNSQMYNVERFGISRTTEIESNVRIVATNMAGPTNLGFSQEYTVRLLLQAGLNAAALSPSDMEILPWFLGAQRNAGITASLSVVSQNIDGTTVKFEAEGYRWSPRSVLIDGGPQRPPTGPFQS